jgi:hypothetical protein
MSALAAGSPIVHQINIGQAAGFSAPPPKTSGLAVASFVLSLVGIFFAGLITGLLAVIFGAVAMNAISKNPAVKGYGLAVAGLVIGILEIIGWGIIVWLIYVHVATHGG